MGLPVQLNPDRRAPVLMVALTINGVAARYAVYLNDFTDFFLFPEAFTPLPSSDEVLAITGLVIVG